MLSYEKLCGISKRIVDGKNNRYQVKGAEIIIMGYAFGGIAIILLLAIFIIVVILLATKSKRTGQNKKIETREEKYYRTRNEAAEAEEKEYYKTHYTEEYLKALIRFFTDKTKGETALDSLDISEFVGKVFSPLYLINYSEHVPLNSIRKAEIFSEGISSKRKDAHTIDAQLGWVELYWSITQEDIDFFNSHKNSERQKIAELEKELVASRNEVIDEHKQKMEQSELVNKCNICGNIFAYIAPDLEGNLKNAQSALLSSVAGLGATLSGHYAAGAVHQGNANATSNQIVENPNKCPKCNSTSYKTLLMSREELQREQQLLNAPQVVAPLISTADELKKFKELLDSDVITQEEFDIKKKQLLG